MSASMTRQHFRDLAELIDTADYLSDDQRLRLADGMARVLRRYNSRFSWSKFIEAATKSNEKGE